MRPSGRSARLIVTLNTPPWIYRWFLGQPGHKTMKKTILEFCDVRPVRITDIGPQRNASAARREQWLQQVRALGADRG